MRIMNLVWEIHFSERTQRNKFKLNSWRNKPKKKKNFSLQRRQKARMVTCSSMKFEVTACELSSYWSVLLRRDSALIKIRAVQIRDSPLLGLLLLGFADPSLPLDRPVGCPFQVAPTPSPPHFPVSVILWGCLLRPRVCTKICWRLPSALL